MISAAGYSRSAAVLDWGFGGGLLSHAITSAWEWPGTRRVWVHTCTLDHPSALQNYQARGFVLYDQQVGIE